MFSISKNKLTVDQAAETLYTIMGKDDKSRWISQLSKVPELDIVRATTELLFLDFFAIYFSIKFTRSPGWSGKGFPVFEKLFSLLLSFLGHYWERKNVGTMDEAFKTLDERLKSYGACIEETSSSDPEKMFRSIGVMFAKYTLTDETFIEADGQLKKDCFKDLHLDLQRKLSQDYDDITITVGGEAFNYRIKSLYDFFDSSKIV